MNLTRLHRAPVVLSTGALRRVEDGALRQYRWVGPARMDAPCKDPAAACGFLESRARRMDRYAALGVAAASIALDAVAARPLGTGDPEWGVVLGTSLGCWETNAAYLGDLERRSPAERSPALFAQTVSNTVNGEISIGWKIGGVDHTIVSGWSAGAEALAEAAALLAEGRARWVLAGAAEFPGGLLGHLYSRRLGEPDLAWLPSHLGEAAAMCLMTIPDDSAPIGGPRIRAYAYGSDADPAWSLSALLRALEPHTVRTVLVANTVPADIRTRWSREAGNLRLVDLTEEFGELGAVGAAVGVAQGSTWLHGGLVVMARGIEGGCVALVLGD